MDKRSTLSLFLVMLLLSPVAAAKRALVIGNKAYQSSPLTCPVNDANDLAATLKQLGFAVTTLTDADQQQMENAIRSFTGSVSSGDTALFYFSGHGAQWEGVNYLIPLKMSIESQDEFRYKAVPAEMVLDKLEKAGSTVNVIILDACRSNPFKRFKSLPSGLAQMNSPAGTLIAYATAPGTAAMDGIKRNSVYTKHLLTAMRTPKLEVEHVLKRVRIEVMKETKNRQVPWESSSLTGKFCFAEDGGQSQQPASTGKQWWLFVDLSGNPIQPPPDRIFSVFLTQCRSCRKTEEFPSNYPQCPHCGFDGKTKPSK